MGTIIPAEPKNDYVPAPSGSHIGTCYGVVDLGTQAYVWQGETIASPQIALFFELPNELMENGKPHTMAAIMPLKSGKKAKLRIFLEAWRGVPFTDADFGKFDVAKLIGIGCMLNVIHEIKDGKTRAKINGVMRLPKGTSSTPIINAATHFTLDAFNQEIFDGLGQYWRETIAKSPEYMQLKGVHKEELQSSVSPAPNQSAIDDEIPF